MKTTLLRNMLATIAALFISMFALPQQAQAQNTVTIDGVEKTIRSTEFFKGYGDDNAFAAYLYLSADKKEYVCIMGNKDLHAIYDYIYLTKKESAHAGQWYWSVKYTKDGYGNELFKASGTPDLDWVVFTAGSMYIYGDPRPSRKICGISLYNGEITDTKQGDGKKHTIKIDYKYERTKPTAGTLTVGNVTEKNIKLSWTHGSDNVTPQEKLYYIVEYKKKGEIGWYMPDVGNATSYTITGLKPKTEYEVNILIQDESGNYDRYGTQTVTTKADTHAPSAPLITSLTSVSNTITVTWGKSTDNVTPQSKIRYRVWYGQVGGNVYSGGDELTDKTLYTIKNLNYDTEYKLYVMAWDEAGNAVSTATKTIRTKRKVINYDLWIADTQVTNINCNDLSVIPGVSGTVKYDHATKTLTLDNATINIPSDKWGIYSKTDGLVLNVKRTVNVTSLNRNTISFSKSATIKGNGTLNVNCKSKEHTGIQIYAGVLTIDGCTVNVKGYVAIAGSRSKTSLIVRNANVTAESTNGLIRDFDQLTLDGCFISQPQGAVYDTSIRWLTVNGEWVTDRVVIEPIKKYDLKIAGVEVTNANCNDLSVIPGVSGTVKYDHATKTLTLDNATINTTANNIHGIYVTSPITIKVKGTVNIKSEDAGSLFIFATSAVSTITGTGTLNLEGWNGLEGQRVVIENITLNAKGEYGGIIASSSYANSTFEIRNANITAEGNRKGSIVNMSSLTLKGCAITQPAGAAFNASLKGVALNGQLVKTKVTITKGATGIDAVTADMPAHKRGIYTLQGVKLNTAFDRLPAGVYIVDGRKVVKK